jgi:hypothetical protein
VRHYGSLRYSPRWLPRALGAAALAAGLTAGLPAGPALASPTPAGSTSYSLFVSAGIKAVGHTWSFGLGAFKGGSGVDDIVAGLERASKGVIEDHEWSSVTAFSRTVAKDFTITSAGHATIKTGSALRPVLAATLAFTPTRHTRETCAKGSDTTYFGKLTGTLSLTTGLRGVKVSAKFSRKTSDASLGIDKSCVQRPPSKTACAGGFWTAAATPLTTGAVSGIETLAAKGKPTWRDSFFRENVRTASKWLKRFDDLSVAGPAPKLNKKAHTVSVTGTASGPITGAAVITYGPMYKPPPVPSCYVGRKRYSEKSVIYTGTKVTVSKPFKAHMVLTGTQTMVTGHYAEYTAVTLKAR